MDFGQVEVTPSAFKALGTNKLSKYHILEKHEEAGGTETSVELEDGSKVFVKTDGGRTIISTSVDAGMPTKPKKRGKKSG